MSEAAQLPADAGIAVIGYACRFPGAPDLSAFWRNLRAGVDSAAVLSDADLDEAGVSATARRRPGFVRLAQVLDDVEEFDADFFGVSPGEAELLDPQQRIFLECAWETFEQAGYVPGRYPGPVGVFAGSGLSAYLLYNVLPALDLDDFVLAYQAKIGNDKDFLPTRLSYKLNLTGPSIAVQTACSTSLVAVHLACQSLLDGECDAALAGACSIMLPQRSGYTYRTGMILSPDGHCRPFDARAQGTVRGSGAGAVLLKRLPDAVRDRDTVHGVILGSAVNNDGSEKLGYTAPSASGQRDAVAQAHLMAGVQASSISYVEAHGTGTELGDPIEVQALADAFRAVTDEREFCALGSVKGNVGHLDTAAGMAGLVKVLLMFRYGEIPPLAHFRSPNPEIDFADTPFYVNGDLRPWPAAARPRRAGVNSTGIGGTNAHIVVEEPAAPAVTPSAGGSQLLVLSARSPQALEAGTDRLAEYLGTAPAVDFADVAFTLQVGRTSFAHRRTVVASSAAQAAELLTARRTGRVWTGQRAPADRPVIFLFAGQGAQRSLMGQSLRATEPVFRAAFDECAAIFAEHSDHDLVELVYGGAGAERLQQSEFAQPALFAVQYALAKLWSSWGVRPAAMLGHSIGEYVAAHLAGVFSLDAVVRLVAQRGRLMQSMPPGAMLAVELTEAETLARLPPGADLAAVNAERRCVVAGPAGLISALRDRLAGAGVRCRPVATSHAFHSAMMEPILAEFTEHVRRASPQPARLPFGSNVTGDWITDEQAASPGYWARHLRSPVRFHDGLGVVLGAGDPAVIDCGPGQTLAGLARRHPSGVRLVIGSMARDNAHPASREPEPRSPPHQGDEPQPDDASVALAGLGRLWASGVPVNLESLTGQAPRWRVPLPSYPFERRRYWLAADRMADRAADRGPAGQPAADAAPAGPADWIYLPTWRRTAPLAPVLMRGPPQRWLLVADLLGLAGALAERIRDQGHQVVIARPSGTGADSQAPAALLASGAQFDHVVHMGGVTGPKDAVEGVHPFFCDVLEVARSLARLPNQGQVTLSVVADRLHAVESTDRVAAGKAPVLGLAAVLPQEAPRVRCRVIDIPAEPAGVLRQALAGTLFAELIAGAADPAVAYRGRRRLLPDFSRAPTRSASAQPPLRHRGVYLITGGTGRVGLCLAGQLAKTWQPRLVLTSRSAFPERAEWDRHLRADDRIGRTIRKLRGLEEAGAEVLVVQADAAAEPQMRSAVVQATERFGALAGVVHAAGLAGIAAVAPLSGLTAATCAEHFRAKVLGTQVLRRVLDDAPPEFVVLMASNATVLGGPGLAAYAAASSYLNAAAEEWSGAGPTRWLAISWDRWLTDDDPPAWPRASADLDRYALTAAEATQTFECALALQVSGQVVVSRAPLADRISYWRSPTGGTPATPVPGRSSRAGGASNTSKPTAPTLSLPPGSAAAGHPAGGLERLIADVWREVLGVSDVGIDENFFDLGGDSLIGLRIVAELERRLDVVIPPVRLYEAPTVRALADLLGQRDNSDLEREADAARQRRQVMLREVRRREGRPGDG